MTDEALSQLSIEDKLKVVRYLVADLAARMMGGDADLAKRARHDIGALAMTFNNLHELLASSAPDDLRMIQSIYNRYRYSPSDGAETPPTPAPP